jgi:aquaporin Z
MKMPEEKRAEALSQMGNKELAAAIRARMVSDVMSTMPPADIRVLIAPYVSEFVGTFCFLSVISYATTANGIQTVPLTSFIIGMALMVCVYMTGGHSGGHLNPAVSFGVFLTSKFFHKVRAVEFGIVQLLGYWAAQFAAAFVAGGCCYAMYDGAQTTDGKVLGGFPARGTDVVWGTAVVNELCGTMTLVLVVLNVATCRTEDAGGGGSANAGNSTFGLAIGGVIAAWAIGGGQVSGGAYNPAVGVLPLVWGKTEDVGIYFLGPFLGAFVAVIIFYVTNPKEFIADNTPIAKFCMLVKDELNEYVGTWLFTMAIALIAGRAMNHGTNGLGIGLMLMTMVYMGGHISGGHYNPAVTLAVTLRGKCPVVKAPLYIISQIAGAFTGGSIAYGIAEADGPINYGYPQFGSCVAALDYCSAGTISFGKAFGAEVMGTFILVLSVLHSATCDHTNTNNSFYGINIGFAVAISAYAFGPLSGGAFNPAVGLLPLLKNKGEEGWWVLCYWTAPFVGALFAVLVFWILNPKEKVDFGIAEVHRHAERGGRTQLGHMGSSTSTSDAAGDTTAAASMEVEPPPRMGDVPEGTAAMGPAAARYGKDTEDLENNTM